METQRYTQKVSELARAAEVQPDVVRYYTRVGLLKPRRQRGNGYKLYEQGDVVRLRFIRKAKKLGYTLKEIMTILDHADGGKSPCHLVRKIIEDRVIENRERIAKTIALQQRMESAIREWSDLPDGMPNADSICHLIEAFVEE